MASSNDTANPHDGGGMSVTLKQQGKDRPWMVFHGSPATIRAHIKEAFPELAEEDGPLWDLTNEAQRLFSAVGNAHRTLGARPVNDKSAGAWAEARGDAPASQPEPQPELSPEEQIKAEIEGAETLEELKEVWMNSMADIQKFNLVELWQTKGKALKGAA